MGFTAGDVVSVTDGIGPLLQAKYNLDKDKKYKVREVTFSGNIWLVGLSGVYPPRLFKNKVTAARRELEKYAQAPAPKQDPTPSSASSPAPLPPEVLADALQDRIHPASGRLLAAAPIKHPNPLVGHSADCTLALILAESAKLLQE